MCYKALLLLEHLLKHGPGKIVGDVQSSASVLERLTLFEYKDANLKDHGALGPLRRAAPRCAFCALACRRRVAACGPPIIGRCRSRSAACPLLHPLPPPDLPACRRQCAAPRQGNLGPGQLPAAAARGA